MQAVGRSITKVAQEVLVEKDRAMFPAHLEKQPTGISFSVGYAR